MSQLKELLRRREVSEGAEAGCRLNAVGVLAEVDATRAIEIARFHLYALQDQLLNLENKLLARRVDASSQLWECKKPAHEISQNPPGIALFLKQWHEARV